MTTALFHLKARIYVPGSSFVPRGRWSYAASLVEFSLIDAKGTFFVDIPSMSTDDAVDFAAFEQLLKDQVFTDEENILPSIKQAVSLLKGYVIEHLERKGVYLDVRASFGVSCIHQNTLYAGGFGRFCLGVYRDDAYYELLSSNDNEVTTLSGFLQEGDIISHYIETYPIEELCVQVMMEDEQREHIYKAYLDTFPSRGVASLILIPQDGDLVEAGVAQEELLSEFAVVGSGQHEEGDAHSTVSEEESEVVEDDLLDGEEGDVTVKAGGGAVVARMILRVTDLIRGLFDRAGVVVWMVFRPIVRFLDHKKLLVLGVVVLVVLQVIVLAGTPYEQVWQASKQVDAAKAAALPPLQSDLQEVLQLTSTSPVRASRMLVKLRSDAQQLPDGVRNSIEGKALIEQIEVLYAQSIRAVRPDAQLFFDVSTVGEGARIGKFTLADGSLFIADVQKDAVYRVDATTRASRAILGSADGISGSLDVIADSVNVYSVSQQGVIGTAHSSSDIKKSIERDSRWQGVVSAALFGGNVYVLDAESSSVWKYTKTTSGFDGGASYIAQDARYSLQEGMDIAIDGYVWLALRNGNVVRLAQGRIDSFTLESLTDQLTQITAIVAPEEHEFLYVLDGEQGRIVQYRKETGGFVQQYVADSLKGAKDFVVDVKSNTVYFGKDSLIYRFNLQ